MELFLSNPLFSMILYLGALVVAITIHEFSHAYMADKLGDPTPQIQGRLTLNPKAHLDKYGSLIFLFLLITRSPFIIGWGKPVQFDPFNLRNPRKDAALISLSGPAANLILALVASILFRILTYFPIFQAVSIYLLVNFLTAFLETIIIVSTVLAVFNLLPIHPLDGFKIVEGFLPPRQAQEWASLERYGYIFLILLIFPLFGSSPLQQLISPVLNFLLSIFLPQTPII